MSAVSNQEDIPETVKTEIKTEVDPKTEPDNVQKYVYFWFENKTLKPIF